MSTEPTRSRVFYGWWVALTAALGLLLNTATVVVFTFGIFAKAIGSELHSGRASVSLAFTLHNLMAAICIPAAGRLVDRLGVRKVLLPFTALFALILISSSFISNAIWDLYVFYVALGVVSGGAGAMPYTNVVSQWFDRRRGLALSVMMLGMGMGAIVMPSIAQRLVATCGWRGNRDSHARPVMTTEAGSPATSFQLLRVRDGLIVHQALYAVAKLGVADLLNNAPRTTTQLAAQLQVNEPALHRVLRALESRGIFEEIAPRTFANNALSAYLRTGVPGSVRSMVIFWGTETHYRPFGEILYSMQTGQPARSKLLGMDVWEYLQQNPEVARIFDDAMTDFSALVGPAIASAYDFGHWGSIMEVGGGNGILLAAILKLHSGLHGVLADRPQVLEHAKQRGFLGGELQVRSAMLPCDFLVRCPPDAGPSS